ncbi:MAG: hypothetical protein QN152_11040 [Armatimonadota bacterium]|nr:hypothetical protein [Armatimonadota bacterium]MDR7540045.1 hypothetical protein [Armatimonadota bacterium]
MRANLENLKLIPLLHPRLALVGVASEIENSYREGVEFGARKWAQDWATAFNPPPFPETSAVRAHLRDKKYSKGLAPELARFVGDLFEQDGAYRHTRAKVSTEDANRAIDLAIRLLEAHREIFYPKLQNCDQHSAKLPWYFAHVLEATPGAEVIVHCSEGPRWFILTTFRLRMSLQKSV